MMKKSLIALAIAGVIAAPAAFAEVKFSGSVSVMANSYDKNGDATNDDTTRIEDGNTFIKISGSEDLGGGLSAIYGFDMGVDISGTSNSGTEYSTNTDDINLQNAIVGLKGSFGTVIAGTFDNPMKVMGGAYELFGNQPGDRRALKQGLSEERSDNVVAYLSPDFNGFSGTIAHFNTVVAETDANNNTATVVVKLQYANGPLNAGVAHYTANYATSSLTDEKALRIAASYKMGDTKFNVMHTSVDNVAGTSTTDVDNLTVGISHTMGPITLKVQHTSMDTSVANSDATLTAFGVDYALSKGTKVFAHYAKMDNQSSAVKAIGGWTGADAQGPIATGGTDPTAFGVGIRHNF